MSGPFGSSQWIYNSGGGFFTHKIEQSARFNYVADNYLYRTPSSDGERKKFVISTWVKMGQFRLNTGNMMIFSCYQDTSNQCYLSFESSERIIFLDKVGNNTRYKRWRHLFRDVSGWMHVHLVHDTTDATANNRYRLWINGVELTDVYQQDNPPQNRQAFINTNNKHWVGAFNNTSEYRGAMAEFAFIGNQTYTPDGNTGEFKDGVWIPKDLSGLDFSGTNSFHLDFANSSNFGNDVSGNDNDYTSNGFQTHDILLDTPTNNYPIDNDLVAGARVGTASSIYNYDMGLFRTSDPSGYNSGKATIGLPKTGKWYFEVMPNTQRSNDPPTNPVVGVGAANHQHDTHYVGQPSGHFGVAFAPSGTTAYAYSGGYTGNSWNSGSTNTLKSSIMQVAVDMDSGKIWVGHNNVYKNQSGTNGDPANGTNPTDTLTAAELALHNYQFQYGNLTNDAGRYSTVYINFGQEGTLNGNKTGGNADDNGEGSFVYSPPSGFLALCGNNLPEYAIDPANGDQPKDHFDIVTYTGNATDGRTVNGLSFQPDLVWIKSRNTVVSHRLYDSVRGATKELYPNLTNAQATDTTSLQSFDSDGFTLGTDSSTNGSSRTFVGWCWKAGGTAVSNTDGTITSQVSANKTAGFSIITYTGNNTSGATVGHGLDEKPTFYIIKKTNATHSWHIYHRDLGATHGIQFASSNQIDLLGYWNDTGPTDSVITLGNYSGVNDTNNFVCYAWHDVEGYSMTGQYEGNSSTEGRFIYTGFRPKLFIVKSNTANEPWMIMDSVRHPDNPNDAQLRIESSNAENNDGNGIDFLSNGIKIRSNIGNWGTNNENYIWIAFAETPIKYSRGK
jgi:hypothetical protein